MNEDKKEEQKKEEPEKEPQRLVLSTTKSVHKPIEIEIDGKVYRNRSLSRTTFDEVTKHEKAAIGGDIESLYKQVTALIDVPIEVLNEIDIRDINSLLEYVMAKILTPTAKTAKEKAEKNVPKPGLSK